MFKPGELHDAIEKSLNEADIVPLGKRGVVVTSWNGPGTPVQAVLATRVNNVWTLAATLDWKGGQPDIGVQAHATW